MSLPEEMSSFFSRRIDGYDEHMINDVLGCKEAYKLMAEILPSGITRILDLGCGTGLELDEIFKRFPYVEVVGIDLCHDMLEKLREKHRDKRITLINGDYTKVDFSDEKFDVIISFETIHHLTCEKKISLYKKIKSALKEGGAYIECDYMVDTEKEEKEIFSEYERIKKEYCLDKSIHYHVDIPLSLSHQREILKCAGFDHNELIFRRGGTAIIVSK